MCHDLGAHEFIYIYISIPFVNSWDSGGCPINWRLAGFLSMNHIGFNFQSMLNYHPHVLELVFFSSLVFGQIKTRPLPPARWVTPKPWWFSEGNPPKTLASQDLGSPLRMQIFHRTKAFSQLDLDQLTQETWWCLAAGCAECQALELFGLCYLELFSLWTCELFFPTFFVLGFWGIFATKHKGGNVGCPTPFLDHTFGVDGTLF